MLDILLIDDTKSVHAYVKSLLAKADNIKTTSVFNGSEALDLLKEKKSFDLIFLDWEMPILNGPSTLEQLKKMGIAAPVIMMTTKNNPEDVAKMLGMGVAEYMMKPFTIDILFEKIAFATGKEVPYAA